MHAHLRHRHPPPLHAARTDRGAEGPRPGRGHRGGPDPGGAQHPHHRQRAELRGAAAAHGRGQAAGEHGPGQDRPGDPGAPHGLSRLPAQPGAGGGVVQPLQRGADGAADPAPGPLHRVGRGAAAGSQARRPGAGARHRRAQAGRRLHRHQRQRRVLPEPRVRRLLGQGAGAGRADRDAPGRHRRAGAHGHLRPVPDLRQPRGHRPLAGVHDLQRRVRPVPRPEALHAARWRLLPLPPRALRPGVWSAAGGGGRGGHGQAQCVFEEHLLRRAGVPGGHPGVSQEPAGVGAPDGRDGLPVSLG